MSSFFCAALTIAWALRVYSLPVGLPWRDRMAAAVHMAQGLAFLQCGQRPDSFSVLQRRTSFFAQRSAFLAEFPWSVHACAYCKTCAQQSFEGSEFTTDQPSLNMVSHDPRIALRYSYCGQFFLTGGCYYCRSWLCLYGFCLYILAFCGFVDDLCSTNRAIRLAFEYSL